MSPPQGPGNSHGSSSPSGGKTQTREGETVDRENTASTSQEKRQIEEMEARGEFDVSSTELLNSERYQSGKKLTKEPIIIDMPANTEKYSMEDFAFQALQQEDGLNEMTVAEFLENYELYSREGRDQEGAKYQQQQRLGVREQIVDELLEQFPNMPKKEVAELAEEKIKSMAALHNPDQRVGGSGFGVTAMGSRRVNSAFGALWRHGRADALYERVKELSAGMSDKEKSSTYLNVRLRGIRK